MAKIWISLEVHEAQQALAAVEDRFLSSSKLTAISEGDEHEIADLSAKILGRVATRLADALYPDQCRWMDNEEVRQPDRA